MPNDSAGQVLVNPGFIVSAIVQLLFRITSEILDQLLNDDLTAIDRTTVLSYLNGLCSLDERLDCLM